MLGLREQNSQKIKVSELFLYDTITDISIYVLEINAENWENEIGTYNHNYQNNVDPFPTSINELDYPNVEELSVRSLNGEIDEEIKTEFKAATDPDSLRLYSRGIFR